MSVVSWKKYAFKSLGVVLVIIILSAAAGLAYVRVVGLPRWAQNRLLSELERSGVRVHCDRLWLDFRHGIVAENIRLTYHGGADAAGKAKKLILGVRPTNWFWGKPVVESLELTEAQISTAFPPFGMKGLIEHASARVRLASDGALDLDSLTAEVLGIRLTAHGYLVPPHKHPAKGSLLITPNPIAPPSSHPEQIYARILDVIQRIRFETKPELKIEFSGDLNEPRLGIVGAEFSCGRASYGHRTIDSLTLTARLENQAIEVKTLRAKMFGGEIEASGRYSLVTGAFEAKVNSSTDVTRFASWMPTPWQEAMRSAKFAANPRLNLTVRTEPLTPRQPVVQGHIAVSDLAYKGVRTKRIEADVSLSHNTFRATQVRIEMSYGAIGGDYEEQLDSRDFTAKCESRIDVVQLAPFFSERQRTFIHFFQFTHPPPHLIGEVHGNWNRPETLQVLGKVELQNFQFRAIPIDRFVADVKIENEHAILSSALLQRPEGEARGTYRAGLTNSQFEIEEDSTLDPHCLKPVLNKNAAQFLDRFRFDKPPHIVGKMSGNWRDIHQLKFDGRIEAGPLWINEVAFTGGATQWFHEKDRSRFTDFRLSRSEGEIRGEGFYHFGQAQATGKLNSTVNAHEVAAVFGAKSVEAIQRYQFGEPPKLEMEGVFDFRAPVNDDLKVKITGKKFRYWRFVADEVATDLMVKGSILSLKNFDASFYGGKLQGEARFDLQPLPIPFSADIRLQKSNLAGVLAALTSKSAKVEGTLSIKMNFAATTAGIETIEGYGEAKAHNGLIWDVPMFGIVSKAMSAVLPGLGYSRATRAELTFMISDGRLRTDDLVIDAGMTRITYRGTLALKNGLDFNVQAHLLGATPLGVVGWVFTPLTKLFEFHLGGQLEDPRLRPLYLPKELFFLR